MWHFGSLCYWVSHNIQIIWWKILIKNKYKKTGESPHQSPHGLRQWTGVYTGLVKSQRRIWYSWSKHSLTGSLPCYWNCRNWISFIWVIFIWLHFVHENKAFSMHQSWWWCSSGFWRGLLLFTLIHVSTIIMQYNTDFSCDIDNTHLHLSMKPDETIKLNGLQTWITFPCY